MPSSEDHIIIWSIETRTYPDFVVRYSDEKKNCSQTSGFGGEKPNF